MKINEKSDVELFVKSWDPLLVRIYCSAAYLNKYLIWDFELTTSNIIRLFFPFTEIIVNLSYNNLLFIRRPITLSSSTTGATSLLGPASPAPCSPPPSSPSPPSASRTTGRGRRPWTCSTSCQVTYISYCDIQWIIYILVNCRHSLPNQLRSAALKCSLLVCEWKRHIKMEAKFIDRITLFQYTVYHGYR